VSRLHTLTGNKRRLRALAWGAVAPVVAVATLCGTAQAYSSLTINATFDSSITSDHNAAAIEGAINAAIANVEGNITSPNNITVNGWSRRKRPTGTTAA
jgi:hypothetical protein